MKLKEEILKTLSDLPIKRRTMAKRCKDCGRYRNYNICDHWCPSPKYTWREGLILNKGKMYKQDKVKGFVEIKSESPKDKVKRYLKEAEELFKGFSNHKDYEMIDCYIWYGIIVEIAKMLQKEEK
jgi:hypothetical protein